MQAVAATATLSAGAAQPSTECPPVELADPASSPSAPATATATGVCRLTTASDQNSNVVDMETNHNHDDAVDSFDETISPPPPSTLTLRLIMQGKVAYERGGIIIVSVLFYF